MLWTFTYKLTCFFGAPALPGHGFSGWTAARDLSGASLYFSTRADDYPSCPVGVSGAYDRDADDAFDPTFSVACHSDAVAKECGCFSVWVNSTVGEGTAGAVAANQSVYLGKYDLGGAFNGHPYYHARKYDFFDAFLYFRKQGGTSHKNW